MVAGNLNGLFAPAAVHAEIIDRIADATASIVADEQFQNILVASGFEPVLDSGPAATRRFIAEELARWTPIIKAAGFKME